MITAEAKAGGAKVLTVVRVINTSVNLSRYYTENPMKIKLLINDYPFKDTEFRYTDQYLSKGSEVEVEEIVYSSKGYPRLKLKDGTYLTSRKDLVQKTE